MDACCEACNALTAEAGVVVVRRYWTLDPRREIRFARDDDYVAAFNELFERVISDNPRKTAARLYLVWAVKQTLANALAVLGVSAPDRMDAPEADD